MKDKKLLGTPKAVDAAVLEKMREGLPQRKAISYAGLKTKTKPNKR